MRERLQTTQQGISTQILRYLKLTQNNTRFLYEIDRGLCYALSLCRSAMRVDNNLFWWESMLARVVGWDGTLDSLKKKQIFATKNHYEFVPLAEIFDRLLNYLCFYQACYSNYPHANLDQYSFLLVDGPFEFVKNDGTLLKIKDNLRIAGHFSFDNLVDILSEEKTKASIESAICLVHTQDHSCELGYTRGVWSFYNPDTGVRYFNHVNSVAACIQALSGGDIAIECAWYEKPEHLPFAWYFGQLIPNHSVQLLQKNGLILLANECPYLIPLILSQAKNQVEDVKKISLNALSSNHKRTALIQCARMNCTESITALCEAGASLNIADEQGATVLGIAVFSGQEALVKMFCQYGADPDFPCSNPSSIYPASVFRLNPFILSIIYKNHALMDYFIENYLLDMHFPSRAHVNFLSIQIENTEIREKFQCQVESGMYKSFIPIHWAVSLGDAYAVQRILRVMPKLDRPLLRELMGLAEILAFPEILTLLQTCYHAAANPLKRAAEDQPEALTSRTKYPRQLTFFDIADQRNTSFSQMLDSLYVENGSDAVLWNPFEGP